jgi:hypothetical protein
MIVSRPYVKTDKIVEFGLQERFLKLPIEKYLENEGIEPNSPQIAMINMVQDPRHRFINCVYSRRTGKTYFGNVIAFLKLLEPGTQVLIIAPNYSLANISWMAQLEMVKKHGLETERANAKDKEMVLENGSLLKIASVGNANAALGRSYDLVLFDESAIDDRGGDAFNIVLAPTLDKPNSKAIFISTPRGDNWCKEFYDFGYDDGMLEWASALATYKDNPRVPQSVIDSARKGMSKATFQQEFECSFTTREGVIYEDFDFEEHLFNLETCGLDFTDRDRFEAIMGIDPGYRDATAVIVIKYDFINDIFYAVEEYQQAARSTAQHAEHISRMDIEYEPEAIFIDYAAAQFGADLAFEHDVSTSKAKKSILDGITFVQMLIQQNKFYVADHLAYTKAMLTNYIWKPDSQREVPLHNDFSHMADAVRYCLYSYDRM